MGSNEIKEYLELLQELGGTRIVPTLVKKRDELRKILEDKIPALSTKAMRALAGQNHGTTFESKMVKNFRASYFLRPLSADGSIHTDGRFHMAEWAASNEMFKSIYLAPNEHVVNAECRINPFEVKSPRVNVWVKVKLTNVFDASELESKFPVLRLVSREPWEFINIETISFTQFLGRFLASQGYSGIVYRSARMTAEDAKNICIFPINMANGDRLEVLDPDGVYEHLKVPSNHLEFCP